MGKLKHIGLLRILYSIALIFSVSSVALSQSATGPVQTVPAVDIKRYSGLWYEIASYPNKFQKHCVGNTTATYSAKSDGKIDVLNKCLKKNGTTDTARGEARIADMASNAKLKVRFAPGFLSPFGFVWGDYWVIDLGPNYEYAVVADPAREYLWVLSRTPKLSDTVYQQILRRLETQGFKPGKLEKTAQNVEALKGSVVDRQ